MVKILLSRPCWMLTADRLLVILLLLSLPSLFFDSPFAGSMAPGNVFFETEEIHREGKLQTKQWSNIVRIAEKYWSMDIIKSECQDHIYETSSTGNLGVSYHRRNVIWFQFTELGEFYELERAGFGWVLSLVVFVSGWRWGQVLVPGCNGWYCLR